MARGSWQGLYNDVIDGLMLRRHEQELLLLMAIARYCDPFGFCFPGRINLMRARRISQPVYERRLGWLQENSYVVVIETYDYRRRQTQWDFQINPRVLYVREEVQEYCERVFDAVQERDFDFEKRFLEILFSTKESSEKGSLEILLRTKESQTEVVPESETETEPASGTSSKTRNHNQLSAAPRQTGRNAPTMRNGAKPEKQPKAKPAIAHRENDPQAGPPAFDLDMPILDRELLIKAIMHVASTTEHQAREAVDTYPLDNVMHWLRNTALRRERGQLKKPGGYFFRMLTMHSQPIEPMMPNGQTYQDFENDNLSDDMEV